MKTARFLRFPLAVLALVYAQWAFLSLSLTPFATRANPQQQVLGASHATASTAITFITSAAAQSSSATFGATPTAGDLIVVLAHRDGSTTAPTMVTGYFPLDNAVGANTDGEILAGRISDGTETTTGTWTNATSVVAGVYRNAVLGAAAMATSGNCWTLSKGSSTTLSYGTVALANTAGTSWVVGLGAHRSATNVNQAPTGMSLRNSATDCALSDTGAGVSSWSAQTVTVNASSGWATYALELLQVPAGGLGYTVIQNSPTTGIAAGTTAACTLNQAVGSEPHILVIAPQFTAFPVAPQSIDKGGTMILLPTTQGAAPDGAGSAWGYCVNSTTATSPITVTFPSTTGGCNISIMEIAYTGTGTPSVDCANTIYNDSASTSISGPAFTTSAAQTVIVMSSETTHNNTALASPYSSPTGFQKITGGNLWGGVLNRTSGSTPAITLDSSGNTGITAVAFGASPTAFANISYCDFEGSTDGTTVTEALLHAGMHGWGKAHWELGGASTMTFSSAASHGLLNAIARLCDGSSVSANAGSLGLRYQTSQGTDFVRAQYFPLGGNIAGTTWRASVWFKSDLPGTDASNMDVFSIAATSGANFANAKFLRNGAGTSRTFHLEVVNGSETTSVDVPSNVWLYLVLTMTATSSTLQVYDATGTLIGTCTETPITPSGNGAFALLGNSTSPSTPTTGYNIWFGDLQVTPTGETLQP